VRVLLVGGGGREHALAWKIGQSPLLDRLFVAPGNPGLKPFAQLLPIAADAVDALVEAARSLKVDLVVVGPEAPLALGLSDRLRAAGVPCLGPSRAAARLEASKSFMKEVATRAGAPTAAHGCFEDARAAKRFLREQQPPYVVKADGLAAGKGVVVAEDLATADAAIDAMLGGEFGAAGSTIVIEEFLRGEEASFFVLSDGETAIPLSAAQDYKRAFDGDRGPNTGGMGAYSPAPVFTTEVRRAAMTRIVEPTLAHMREAGAPYAGVLFAGLMIADGEPKLVEFNCRFGDPECQVLMRRLRSDLLPLLHRAATGTLAGAECDWSAGAAAAVVLAADGYPGAYRKGSRIGGVERANALPGVVVFHAGTEEKDGMLLAAGGRVLTVSATGAGLAEAISRAYAGVDAINWPEGFCRRDIGARALERAR
jgi:phosphoribosylamine--glycine ligase